MKGKGSFVSLEEDNKNHQLCDFVYSALESPYYDKNNEFLHVRCVWFESCKSFLCYRHLLRLLKFIVSTSLKTMLKVKLSLDIVV